MERGELMEWKFCCEWKITEEGTTMFARQIMATNNLHSYMSSVTKFLMKYRTLRSG